MKATTMTTAQALAVRHAIIAGHRQGSVFGAAEVYPFVERDAAYRGYLRALASAHRSGWLSAAHARGLLRYRLRAGTVEACTRRMAVLEAKGVHRG